MRYGWPVALVLALVAVRYVPPAQAASDAEALWEDDPLMQQRLKRGVFEATSDMRQHDMGTGSARFDGEWRFATLMMAGVGHAQVAMVNLDERNECIALADLSVSEMLAEEMRAFDTAAWGRDALRDLDQGAPRAHLGYLGYLNLLLSLRRNIAPGSQHDALNDRITAHLMRVTDDSDIGLAETYPGETYPVDNAVFLASVALHGRATGADHQPFIERWLGRLSSFRDAHTGLLYQAVDSVTGEPMDEARGSGTALAAWLLSFVDRSVSADLHRVLREQLMEDLFGFGALREYARGNHGWGDVDSGPVVMGWSVSATGFALASARAHGDRAMFEALYATVHLMGRPVDRGKVRRYALGGPMGDAMMFALLTARPATEWEER